MLNKRILRKLEPPVCKKAEEYFCNVEKLDFVLQFSTHIVDHQRLLFIDIFGKQGDLLRVFIHRTSFKKDEYEYTTFNYSTKNWLSASIQNLRKRDKCGNRDYLFYSKEKAFINAQVAIDYFGFSANSTDCLLFNINNCMLRAETNRLEAKRIKLADYMKGVPNPSNRQRKWMETLFYDEIIGFAKGKSVFCGYCGKTFKTEFALKSKSETQCPCCKAKLLIRSHSYRGGRDGLRRPAYIITKLKGKAILRHFTVTKFFNEKHEGVFDYFEFARDVVNEDELLKCERDYWYKWRKGRYTDFNNFFHTSPYKYGCLYRGNLKSAIKNTPIQYCGIEFTDKYEEIRWDMYLDAYYKYPMLESLIKIGGFNRLLLDICDAVNAKIRHYRNYPDIKFLEYLKPGATTLSDFLGIQRNHLSDIISNNLSLEEVVNLQRLKNANVKVTKDEIKYLIGERNAVKLISSCEKTKLSVHKVLRYIEQQKSNISFYVRYIEECEKLGLDLTSSRINRTRNLDEMFTKVYDSNQVGVDKKLKDTYSRLYTYNLSKLNVTIDGLCFSVPKSFTDFVKQGTALKHCICRDSSYFKKVVDCRAILVFISDAKNPNKPLFTCEVSNGFCSGELRNSMCNGYDNKTHPNEKQNSVIEKFIKYANNLFTYKDCKIILREQPQLASA